MTEYEKMLKGMIYDSTDEEIFLKRSTAHKLSFDYNMIRDENDSRRQEIISKLIPNNKGIYLQGPIYFDYGVNTSFGSNCYANFNFTVLDTCPVTIGNNVFFGPNVSIVTPVHPLIAKEREMFKNNKGLITDNEYAKPIVIKDDCWIASSVTICGGVTIGKGVVIGAGSVVIKDIEDGVFAAGNPCKAIRRITEEDSIFLKKGLF